MEPTYYAILGLAQTATPAEVKNKYRDAARKYHPDVAADKIQATRLFIQINLAYRILIDVEQRRRYDLSLQRARAGTPPPPRPEPVNIPQTIQQAEHAYFQGRMPEARALCAKILQQDGRHGAALGLMGDILMGLNKPEEAAIAYRVSLQVTPSFLIQAKLADLAQRQARSAGAAPAAGSKTATTAGEPKPGGLLKRVFDRK